MSTLEPKLVGRFVTFVYPKPLSYGFQSKEQTRKELYVRVAGMLGNEKLTPREVYRYLYPMQLGGYLKYNILQMVTGPATSVVKRYTAINLPNGAILYVEEVGEELYIFVVSPGNGLGFQQLCRLIR
jgi:hypothetical protein